jgi:hypothetical protein
MTRARSTALRGILVVAALVAAVLVPSFSQPERADALSAADWDPGNIISDANFYNGSAMSEGEIQQFLETTVGGCQNSNCLAAYRADTPTRTWSFGTCSTYVGGVGESAARIIFKVQQACNLSAKVILVTLQKEQGLLTNRAPSDGVMRKAMGYGCPDTAACDSTYYGFFNQVFAAGRQLTWYGNPAGSFTSIKVGQNNAIQYHPNAGCGTKNVLVRNRGTAALYYYTPYTPNAAALANLGGTGDGCSSYGNRNFWVFYNNWFGSPTGGGRSPIGNIELMTPGPGSLRVAGWALDPDTSDSISVHVYIGPNGTALNANINRSDVAATYGLGAAHGFDATLPVSGSGLQDVCVYAINTGGGANSLLLCKQVQLMGGAPIGAVDPMQAGDGTVTVSGWAIDPDQTGAAQVHVYVGSSAVAVTADRAVSGLGARYPGYGDNHGFQATVPAQPGPNRVCVYVINSGPGSNVELTCQTVDVVGEQGRTPVGNAEVITAEGSAIRVAGWAVDPDTTRSISVHVYVGSNGRAITADRDRPDIAAAYPSYGKAHGFTDLISVSPGTYDVCVYAINTGAGGHTPLRCTSVSVGQVLSELGRTPIGKLEGVKAVGSGVEFTGWALDPDTAVPIDVHLYVGSSAAAIKSDLERADVGQTYPAHGPKHGFRGTVSVGPGSYTACAYAINTGPGGHTQLGCSPVTVSSAPTTDLGRAPFGNLELVAAGPRSIRVAGWTIDPDTTAPTAVHVYVGPAGFATTADRDRADVAAAYPGFGPAHGYDVTVEAPAGPQEVCVYGINTGPGGHTLIACRTVDVPG